MSGGVRPKGSKSYAATRSPEAAEAFRQDRASQKTLDAEQEPICPVCGSPMGKAMDKSFRLWWVCIYDHCKGAILIDKETAYNPSPGSLGGDEPGDQDFEEAQK